MTSPAWSAYDNVLASPVEDIDLSFRGMADVPWFDFHLNPRRLRGSDFLMRWKQGAWSEARILQAINGTTLFCAVPYGPSSVAPEDVREHELYFDRLEAAGLGKSKRPDILVFPARHATEIGRVVRTAGGVEELPFLPETDSRLAGLLSLACMAVECENSLWFAAKMPDYNAPLRPMKRLGNRPGLPKNAVLPTVILKDEDRQPLRDWQTANDIPIHVWHLFYDLAYGISLDRAETVIADGTIEPSSQMFQAPGGATTTKNIFKIYHHHAYEVGHVHIFPEMVADHVINKNGHVLPYVRFEGGELALGGKAIEAMGSPWSEKP